MLSAANWSLDWIGHRHRVGDALHSSRGSVRSAFCMLSSSKILAGLVLWSLSGSALLQVKLKAGTRLRRKCLGGFLN